MHTAYPHVQPHSCTHNYTYTLNHIPTHSHTTMHSTHSPLTVPHIHNPHTHKHVHTQNHKHNHIYRHTYITTQLHTEHTHPTYSQFFEALSCPPRLPPLTPCVLRAASKASLVCDTEGSIIWVHHKAHKPCKRNRRLYFIKFSTSLGESHH